MNNKIKTLFVFIVLIVNISSFIPIPFVYASTTETIIVTASGDDCWLRNSTDVWSTSEDYIWIGDVSDSDYDDSGGMRFLLVDVPQGAVIDSAFLNLTAYTWHTATPTVIIHGEDADDTVTFSSQVNYEARIRTSSSVNWIPDAWVEGTEYQSEDIKTIIQEIVDRPSWSSNNSIVIFVSDASGWGGSQKLIRAYSWDYTGGYEPELEINWTVSNNPPTFSDFGSNETSVNAICLFYSQWQDDGDLNGYIFGTNNTGNWINDTWIAWSPVGTPKWSNITKTLTSIVGLRVEWQIWVNDTSDLWNTTELQFLTTTSILQEYATTGFVLSSVFIGCLIFIPVLIFSLRRR